MLQNIEPRSFPGRPPHRARALDTEGNLNMDQITRPNKMIGQIIHHNTFLTGMCTGIRVKPDRVTVFQVVFVDAPGGTQAFEMEAIALIEAVKIYQDFLKTMRRISGDQFD